MLVRFRLICALSLLALLSHAAAAYAAPGDPAPGSPSGAVYELPLERARVDAAPRGSATADAEGAHYRSENNFGSSSQVPGAPGEAGETGGATAPAGGASTAGSAEGGEGSGSPAGEGKAPGGGTASASVGAVQVADTGNTSLGAALALLGAIGLVAIAVAVVAARGNRLGSR